MLEATIGIGLVDDRDLSGLLAYIDGDSAPHRLRIATGPIEIVSIARAELAVRFAFDPNPRADIEST